MSKLRAVMWDKKRREESPDMKEFLFWCPGCERHHLIRTGSKTPPNWTFNGDLEKPTFSPSYLCGGHVYNDDGSVKDMFVKSRCHSFIENGSIWYLEDCHHTLKGQTVALPDVEEARERIIEGKDDAGD